MFQAFDDWIPPVHTYSAVPFAAAFGPTRTAVRLLSIAVGTATVLGTYVLGRMLFGERVGLVASLMLAVSPWHFAYSGIGHPVIMLPLLVTWGAALALFAGARRGQGARRPVLVVAGVVLALATFSYPVGKLFVPALLAAMLTVYRRALARPPFLAAFALTLAPFALKQVIDWHTIQGRFDTLSVLQADQPLIGFLRGYALHYWPPALFWHGFRDGLMVGPVGARQMLAVEAVFFTAGLIVLVRRRREPSVQLTAAWLLLYPVASSLTYPEVPHEVRSAPGYPVLQLVVALGIVSLLDAARSWLRGIRGNVSRSSTDWLTRATGSFAPYALALAVTVNVVFALDQTLRVGPTVGTRADASFRTGVSEALEYLGGPAAGHYDLVWFPQMMGTFFRVLYLSHLQIPPQVHLAGDLPALRSAARPAADAPLARSVWITDQTREPPPPGWQLRRVVMGLGGEPVLMVYATADLPTAQPDVVSVRSAPLLPGEVARLGLLVLLACAAVFRTAHATP